jgi:Ion channel
MMVKALLAAACLMALCVTIHASGVAQALRRLRPRVDSAGGFWREAWLFILAAAWMILLHLVEVCVWGGFYFWSDSFPDLQTAFYFSAVTYTTTGYGDLVLPEEWRLVGGIEALTGILMCGWSTGFFMALVSRVYAARSRDEF